MEVLVYLASKPGEVVSNDELIEQLWAPAVVGDDAVIVVISELRKALEDDPKRPRYIARIPKRGYQLIARVDDQQHLIGALGRSTVEAKSIPLPQQSELGLLIQR